MLLTFALVAQLLLLIVVVQLIVHVASASPVIDDATGRSRMHTTLGPMHRRSSEAVAVSCMCICFRHRTRMSEDGLIALVDSALEAISKGVRVVAVTSGHHPRALLQVVSSWRLMP